MGRGNLQTNNTLALHTKESFAEKNGYLHPVAVGSNGGSVGRRGFLLRRFGSQHFVKQGL